MGRTAFRFALTALLTAGALWYWQPEPGNPLGRVIKGLDLAGGAELVYRIRIEELPEGQRDEVLAQAAGVIQKRLVLSEAKVARHGADRLLVHLPYADQQTVENLKSQIRKSGRLEWRVVLDEGSDRPDLYRRAVQNRKKGLPPPAGMHWYDVIGDQGVRE